jgi:rSAM/selenodomain-associated transferase 1
MRRQLAVFAKPPRLGRVKRRLSKGIGAVEAMQFYRTTLERLLRRLCRDRRWRLSLWIDGDAGRSARWPRLAVFAQGRGDLGRRIERAFRALPKGPLIVIGSDIPDVAPGHIAEAFAKLGQADAVFGPALDGGFWLIGLSPRARGAHRFRAVRWSSRFALADVLAPLKAKRIALLDPLRDIDTALDYHRWRASVRGQAKP